MGKILYYTPDVGFSSEEIARRQLLMRPLVPGNYVIEFSSPPEGPKFVDSDDDVPQAIEAVKKHIPTIEPDQCDALLLGEALDVVLALVRPLARVPTVGPGEETLRLAATIGKPTSIIVMHQLDKRFAQTFIKETKVKPEIVSFRSIDIPLNELLNDLELAKTSLKKAARAAVEEDGAEAIYLGAMTLTTLGLTDFLRYELGVPVYDPLRIGLKAVSEVIYSQIGNR